MKKISTLFKVIYNSVGSKGTITQEVRPENTWVVKSNSVLATRKFDGTATMVLQGKLYKRYDAKPTKEDFKNHKEGESWKVADFREVPEEAVPCQDPDLITGHYPHWIPVLVEDKSNKYMLDTYYSLPNQLEDGTYEFCGEKVGTNPEKLMGHKFIKHGSELVDLSDYTFESIRDFLSNSDNNLEGIVFHNLETLQMCKIRKSDFGFRR